jgi:hypothetical protein
MICQFPCDCPNPNDCSHECENPCGAPALLRVHVVGLGGELWMCLKHADYEAMCLERSAHCLRREIQKAKDSVMDVDFKWQADDGGKNCEHWCYPPTDQCEKDCPACALEAKEALRLEREAIAEDEANESAPYGHESR